MKRITVNEDIYAKFKELCSANKCNIGDMLEILIDSYASIGCSSISKSSEALVERISSLELELLELRNQLI